MKKQKTNRRKNKFDALKRSRITKTSEGFAESTSKLPVVSSDQQKISNG